VAEGRTRGASLPITEQTLAVYDEAIKEGWGKRDGASLPAYWPSRSSRAVGRR
jgi:3-hydroxyisobutyrate dehydrogenase-like beta-hydroxyacid dehydrogenase